MDKVIHLSCNRPLTNDSIPTNQHPVNIIEPIAQKHPNKIPHAECSCAANNAVEGPNRPTNLHYNDSDSVEGLFSQNCPIPTRITQRAQTSKRHRNLSRKRYSQYKYKKHNVISQINDHSEEVFRTGSPWKNKMKFFQLYY